jgi:hypothetical protein
MKQLIIKNIPDEVHKAFKLACLKNDTDMREAIIDMMMAYAGLTRRNPLLASTASKSEE